MTIYIDEAGRGPLAGPVYVGACFFDGNEKNLSDFDDSKKLSSHQRDFLYAQIQQRSDLIVEIGKATSKEIDTYGIIIALRRATRRAIKKISDRLVLTDSQKVQLVIDGNHTFGLERYGYKITTIIKGDSLIKQISVASMVAKIERDTYMYPNYGFERHKGYGTLKHRDAIKKYGLCKEHRVGYCTSSLL